MSHENCAPGSLPFYADILCCVAGRRRTGETGTTRAGAGGRSAAQGVSRLLPRVMGLLAVLDGFGCAALAQQIVWNPRVPGPAARSLHAMAYDSGRDATVLFGGNTPTGRNNETWEWNGTTWTLRSTSGPDARGWHSMVYDSMREVTVLYGGAASTYFGDTWEWNGAVWTQQLNAGPPARVYQGMAYDSVRHVTVLFGGLLAGALAGNAETWEYNGTSWIQRRVGGPSARYGHSMAFDAQRGVTVLFGGSTGGNETWEWSGTAWTQRTPASGSPPPRLQTTMVFDSIRNVCVLFGGNTGGYNAETWEWNGVRWAQRLTPGPAARYDHAMCFDRSRRATLMFGGNTAANFNAELWGLGEPCGIPTILFQDSAQSVCQGTSTSLVVNATGAAPLTFQWRKGGTPISTADNATARTGVLRLANVSSADTGCYDCVIANGCGVVNSSTITLSPTSIADVAGGGTDGNQPDGVIDGSDFIAFLNAFSAGC